MFRLTPNLEHQVICDRGFLPIAFAKSPFMAANATLLCSGYFISLVPVIPDEHSLIRYLDNSREDLQVDTVR